MLLKRQQTIAASLAQQAEIKTETGVTCPMQAAQTLAKEHRGTATVAALEMQMRHRHLKDALEHLAAWSLRFVPELFEAVVAGVPLSGVEKPDGLPKAGISHQAHFLRHEI